MIKRVALLVMIAILSLSAPALAAEPGSGMIEGQVVNGTQEGSSVAEQDVTLKVYLNDAEVDSTTTRTDAEGQFMFDGLLTEPGYSYEVTITFQEADYTSGWLSFDDGETSKFTEVTVYDATTSDESIKVMMAHTVIYVEEGSLQVSEYFIFVNEADRTYIGSKEITADGTREILRFSLPEEATEVQAEYGLMECCIYSSEDGFVETMPLLPGGKEIVYSYRLAYNSGTYTFSQRVNYPIFDYNFLVQGEAVKVTSDQLTSEESLLIEDTLFSRSSSQELDSGDTLVVQLSGLPDTSNRGAIMWVVLALVVLTGSFGFGYLLKKRRLQPVSREDSLDQRRQRLLVELAQLDDDLEGGKIPQDVYHRRRAERKAQLVELMQRSKEERTNR